MSLREIQPNHEMLGSGSLRVGKHSVNLFNMDSVISSATIDGIRSLGFDIPGLSYSSEPSNAKSSITYGPDDKTRIEFDIIANSLIAHGKKEDFDDGLAFAYLAFWLTEAERQTESIYTMQSAVLRVEDKGVMLLGYSGDGKTSTLLKLCQAHKCQILSNNLTFVGYDEKSQQLYATHGTTEIRPRFTSIQDFPELKRFFVQDDATWETKVNILPEEIGARTTTSPVKIDKIFEVHYDNRGQDKLVVREEKELDVRYRLYENMSRILRGVGVSVFGHDSKFLGYLPSLDTSRLHDLRVNSIEAMVNKIGIISVSSGDLAKLTEAIYTQISS